VLLWYNRDWDGAEQQFQRAIELDPNYAPAHQWSAWIPLSHGDTNEAVGRMQRALQLDPLSLITNTNLAFMLHLARRYDQAITQARATLELDSTFVVVRVHLAQSLLQKGQTAAAVTELERVVRIAPRPVNLAYLGYAYARTGRRADAQRVLAELEARSGREYVFPSAIALVHMGLDDREQALAWLERAVQERDPVLISYGLLRSPEFEPLHSHPRVLQLLSKMGMQ
jgi:tetratricopeptide (TPR) repeat protein